MGPHNDLKYKLLIPLFALSWVVFTLLRAVMIIIGWVLIPLAALSGAYEAYQGYDGAGNPRVEYKFTWKLLFPWSNWEDGVYNDTYWAAPHWLGEWRIPIQIIYWSALRNPANNLRIMPGFSLKIEPKKIKWFGSHDSPTVYDKYPPSAEWFICWHGPYSCWWWQFKFLGSMRRLWIGFKLFPSDYLGVSGHRTKGAGFTNQFKRLK